MEQELKKRLTDVTLWLQAEYAAIRTGQATPALLDGVKVESYGSMMPLNQIGSLGTEDARTLRISPWDTTQIAAIERALREADLGVSVMTDSAGVRVVFPELTVERRAQLLKLAKSKLEDARIRVRGVRDELMKQIDAEFKAGTKSEDARFADKEKVQKHIEEANNSLESIYDKKERELQQ